MTKRRNGAFVLGGAAVIAVVALGFTGWQLDGAGYSDALFRSFQAFVLGDIYRDIADPKRLPLIKPSALPYLEAARWGGGALAFSTVIVLLWSGLAMFRIGLTARRRRLHFVVIGDTAFADRLSETISGDDLKRQVVQLRAPDQQLARSGRLIRMPFHGFDHDGFDEAGAARAQRIIIATGDQGQAVDLALAAHRRYPSLSIITRLSDGGLLRSLHGLPGGETLRAFSEAEAAARAIVRRHPPFLLAEDSAHDRIHALLIGDSHWVEALMVEIVLTSRILTLKKPCFTIVVAEPDDLKRCFGSRYPELDREADVDILPFDAATCAPALHDPPKLVTAAYVAFDDGARALASTLELSKRGSGWDAFRAPIFVRTAGDQGLERPQAGKIFDGIAVVPFGGLVDVICAGGILSDEADGAERQWHETYLRLNPSSGAAVPWEQLNEDYRLSNRRAVAHVYAKLHSAGFDLRPWLADADPWDSLPDLAPGEALFRDEPELMRLAELEHERWNADRRLLGWRFGPTKDAARKIHPCLIDFEDLSPDIQHYDVELIRDLDRMLPRKEGGLKRRAIDPASWDDRSRVGVG